MKKKAYALLLATAMGVGSVTAPAAIAAPNPNGAVRTYNTYPGLVSGMVAPQAQVTEGHFTSKDGKGTQIYWKKNLVPQAKGTVALIHGLAESQARYDYITYRLNLEGYNVYRLDHRGHGRSAAPYNNVRKNLIDNFAWVDSDIKQLVDTIHQEQTGKVFMMGHSMGAMAAQYFAVNHSGEIDGLVTNGGGVPANLYGQNTLAPEYLHADGQSAPFFLDPVLQQPGRPFQNADTLLGVDLQGALAPYGIKLSDLPGVQPTESPDVLKNTDVPNVFHLGVVSDPDVRNQLANDPLNSKVINLSTMLQIAEALLYTGQHAKNYTGPTLIMHGDTDGLVPYPLDINWYNAVGSKDKHMILWKGMMHETMNEPARDQVIDHAINWLNEHNA